MRMKATATSLIQRLKLLRSKEPADVAGKRLVPMETVLGVSTGDIRKLAKDVGKDLDLARDLWSSSYVEAKALAILLLPPKAVDDVLIEKWGADLCDWSTCDLFVRSVMVQRADALKWAMTWAASSELYVKRAGLALIANYCMRADSFSDEISLAILGAIEQSAVDDRAHVRQANCWALREFGKSNTLAHDQACILALELIESTHAAKAWVGRCAYQELEHLIKVPERRRLISRKSKTGQKYTS